MPSCISPNIHVPPSWCPFDSELLTTHYRPFQNFPMRIPDASGYPWAAFLLVSTCECACQSCALRSRDGQAKLCQKKSVCAIWSLVPTIFDCFCSPINNAVTLGVLTVVVKGRSLVEVLRRGVWLVRCYAQYIHASRNPQRAFRLRRLAKSGAGAGACRTHFRTWWSLFVASARETSRSCFGGPKSAFRDRRKGSERCYFEMQIL